MSARDTRPVCRATMLVCRDGIDDLCVQLEGRYEPKDGTVEVTSAVWSKNIWQAIRHGANQVSFEGESAELTPSETEQAETALFDSLYTAQDESAAERRLERMREEES